MGLNLGYEGAGKRRKRRKQTRIKLRLSCYALLPCSTQATKSEYTKKDDSKHITTHGTQKKPFQEPKINTF